MTKIEKVGEGDNRYYKIRVADPSSDLSAKSTNLATSSRDVSAKSTIMTSSVDPADKSRDAGSKSGNEQLQNQPNETYLIDPETKQPQLFKYIMIGTNAAIMADLLSTIDDSELETLIKALKAVEYYNSTLQFHTDQKFVSPGRTKVYIPYDPKTDIATLNRSRPDLFPEGAPLVVNSWMMPGQTMLPDPDTVFQDATTHFAHPKVDNNFRHAQHVIEQFQGKHGIYFGGIVAGFNDSHEAAMQANLRVAWMISVAAQFTSRQKYKLEHSAMPVYKPVFKAEQLGVDPVSTCCCC